jgi:AsmA protein
MTLVARLNAAQGGERVRFDAAADLSGVDLRPGGSLAKKPGDPLQVNAAGTYQARGDAQQVHLDRLEATVLGDRLEGTADLHLAGKPPKATTRFEASLRGDRLDLDRLLLPTPEPAPGKGGGAPAPEEKPLDPAAFAGLSGTATLHLGTLRMKRVDARNVALKMLVNGDEVRFEEARLEAFGGSVSAAGSRLALARPDAPFDVALDLKGVAGNEVLKLLGDHDVLSGTLDTSLKLGGAGWKKGLLTASATGGIEGLLRGGAFRGKDLVASVAGPLAAKLPFATQKPAEKGATPLGKELPFAFHVANGVAALTKPLKADTGQGSLSVEGGVKLDGTLEMPVTFSLAPELVGRLTGGRVAPKAPIPVAFRLGGPAWKPQVEGLALDAAVKAIVDQAAAGALGKALGAEGASVDEITAKKRAEAEARAKGEADAQKKKLQEEAKKRLRGILGK